MEDGRTARLDKGYGNDPDMPATVDEAYQKFMAGGRKARLSDASKIEVDWPKQQLKIHQYQSSDDDIVFSFYAN